MFVWFAKRCLAEHCLLFRGDADECQKQFCFVFRICLAFFDSRLWRPLYIEIEIIIYMAISDKYDPPAPEGTQPVKQESESEN